MSELKFESTAQETTKKTKKASLSMNSKSPIYTSCNISAKPGTTQWHRCFEEVASPSKAIMQFNTKLAFCGGKTNL
jgi:hypothetical protein